jgi:hypothetical protein
LRQRHRSQLIAYAPPFSVDVSLRAYACRPDRNIPSITSASDIASPSSWAAHPFPFVSADDCLAVVSPVWDVIVADLEICPTCDRGNNYGLVKGESTCRSFAMPHVLPVRATKDGGRRYCSECLTRVIGERAESAAIVEFRAG